MADRFSAEIGQRGRRHVASMLGLPAEIIIPLRVGYFADQLATTWPMVDSLGACVGLRVRSFHTQVKWSYAGGKTGLFVPDGLPLQPRRLYVCEGPTDTAVMWSIGGAALGRPLKDDRSPEVAEMTSILLSDLSTRRQSKSTGTVRRLSRAAAD